MAARLGNVLFGTACIVAVLWVIMMLGTASTYISSQRWDGGAIIALIFSVFVPVIVIFIIGRAIRYILAGK